MSKQKKVLRGVSPIVWHGGSRPVAAKLPVEWIEHKVRRFTWSGELVQAGTEGSDDFD